MCVQKQHIPIVLVRLCDEARTVICPSLRTQWLRWGSNSYVTKEELKSEIFGDDHLDELDAASRPPNYEEALKSLITNENPAVVTAMEGSSLDSNSSNLILMFLN